MSVRWIGPDSCPTCGRKGGHTDWCSDINQWLKEIDLDRQNFIAAALEETER
jgi:hypothetical protein